MKSMHTAFFAAFISLQSLGAALALDGPAQPVAAGAGIEKAALPDLRSKAAARFAITNMFGRDLSLELLRNLRPSIQQAVPGPAAGNAIGGALGWNRPAADTARDDLRLLFAPDPRDARSRRQVECDAALRSSTDSFADWHSKADAADPDFPHNLEHFPAWFRAIPDGATRRAAAPVAAALQVTLAKCFDSAPPQDFPEAMRQVVGALSHADRLLFCTVIRLAATRVATARHCLEPRGVRLSDAQVAQLRVHFPGAPADGLPARGFAQIDERSAELLPNDWVVLQIESPQAAAEALPIAPLDRLKVGTRMLMAGLLIGTDKALDPPGPVFASTLSCMVVFATDDCIVHSCNTFPGMSGAPIFVNVDGRWHFAGVHSRAMDSIDFVGCSPPGKLPDNFRTNGGIYAGSLRQ